MPKFEFIPPRFLRVFEKPVSVFFRLKYFLPKQVFEALKPNVLMEKRARDGKEKMAENARARLFPLRERERETERERERERVRQMDKETEEF